jgi:flagella basal body P-ring formation protein FlgA
VPIELHVDGVRYRTIWTSWEVEVFEMRSVLTNRVKMGQELTPAMFTRQRVRIQAGRTFKLLDHTMIVGAVAKRDFQPGEVVTALDVYRPTVVTLGDPLILRVKKGAISAQITVQALESGSVGDRIRLRATGTGREIVATIKSRDYCELHLR